MALKKIIPFLGFFMAAGVFATGTMYIRIERDDSETATVFVSVDLTAEEAIQEALSKVPSIPQEDYELYSLSVADKQIDGNEKLSNYANYSWLNLKQ